MSDQLNLFADIRDFHEKFELPPVSHVPANLSRELHDFRVKFMQEELDEYKLCALAGDLEGQLDALVDLVYVALGTAYLQRLPFNSAWRRAQAANMAKVRALRPGDSKRGSTFDVVKPPGWVAPTHADLVENPIIAIAAFDADTRRDDAAPR